MDAVLSRRRWPRRVLIGVAIFVGVCVLAAGALYGYYRYRAAQLKTIHLPGLTAQASVSTPMNILLVGSNTRTGLDPGEAAAFGSAVQVPGARSDVTMILRLNPANGSASLLSIPRDLFVPLPPHSMAGSVGKIDAALNDGPNNLITAITEDLGIPINHFVEINFDGFQRTINAVGGISMRFPTPLRDSLSGLDITTTGCRHLSGAAALAVVRARHLQYFANGRWNNDPLSDLARIRRDHTFLRIFVKTAKAQLTNPLRVNALVGGLLNQVTVDSGLNAGRLLGLLRRYRYLDPDTVPETTLPITVVPNYHFGAGAYGDVDMPVEPLDHQVIDAWHGQAIAVPALSLPRIDLVNISGSRRASIAIAAGLKAAGFPVGSSSGGLSPARTTETVIRYPPGSVESALTVLHALAGAVMMHPDPGIAAGTVTVEVGSVVAVAPPGAPGVPATPTTPTAAGPSAPATTTTTVLTAGAEKPSPAVDQPVAYDPTAC